MSHFFRTSEFIKYWRQLTKYVQSKMDTISRIVNLSPKLMNEQYLIGNLDGCRALHRLIINRFWLYFADVKFHSLTFRTLLPT